MTKLTEAFQEMIGILNAFVSVLNAVHTNIWAIFLVVLAVNLYRDGKDAAALAICTGAFTMLQAGRSAAAERQ